MSGELISATRPCGSGGTDLVRCSLPRSGETGSTECVHSRTGGGIWMRFIEINGEAHHLWRAVDHEGDVLETCLAKRRDRKAAFKFLGKSMKRYGHP